jgi:WD40 repeat protein
LLASPEAARSRWVGREVSYWVQHKPAANLLIVLTDGELVWDEVSGDFDWEQTTALPPALRGKLVEEPRYIDLRWARDEDQVSLHSPHFRECVADLAAPLHGLAKDELVGEDVRQHRRTVRLARSAVVLLAVLALAAGGSAVVAVGQRNDAQAKARLALSRQLAAQATTNLDSQVDRALLLSLEALRSDDTAEARAALLAGLQQNPRLIAPLRASAPVATVAFSPDGKLLASGGGRNTIQLWNAVSHGRIGEPLTGHRVDPGSRWENTVTAVAFSPDGRTLASAGHDPVVLLWDTRTRRRLGELRTGFSDGVSAMAFSPDGSTLATLGSADSVILWDLRSRRPIGEPLGERGRSSSLAFSPDGSVLALGGARITLWDPRTGRQLRRFAAGPTSDANILAFSPDGRMLASGGGSGDGKHKVALWDVRSGRLRGEPLLGHGPGLSVSIDQGVTGLAFSPDGRTLASGGDDGKVVLWDVASRRLRDLPLLGHRLGVRSLAFSPDGTTLASGGEDSTIALWDVRGKGRLSRLIAGSGRPESLAFSPDGVTVAAGGDADWLKPDADARKTVIRWDVRTRQQVGAPIKVGHEITALVLAPDGKTLATGDSDGGILLWDARTGRSLGPRLTGHRSWLSSLAFSPDGRLLASGSLAVGPNADPDATTTVIVWDVRTHRRLGEPLVGHRDHVLDVAFSTDGKLLATASADGTVILWDVPARRRIGEPLTGHGTDLPESQFGPTGRLGYDVSSLAFSPDGKLLASGSYDNTVILWDTRSRRPIGEPLAVGDDVLDVAFSPDGRMLAALAWDRILLWDTRGWQALGQPLAGRPGGQLAFRPDGKVLASAGTSGIILWDTDLASWKALACARASRNLNRAEWDQFIGTLAPYRRTCPQFPDGRPPPARS